VRDRRRRLLEKLEGEALRNLENRTEKTLKAANKRTQWGHPGSRKQMR
jgi:hypothetical protein